MSETEVIRSMVMSFRLQELQILLASAGKNRLGRKSELQTRALNLIKSKDPSITKKVKEMSKAMFDGIANAPSVNPHSRTFVGYPEGDLPPAHVIGATPPTSGAKSSAKTGSSASNNTPKDLSGSKNSSNSSNNTPKDLSINNKDDSPPPERPRRELRRSTRESSKATSAALAAAAASSSQSDRERSRSYSPDEDEELDDESSSSSTDDEFVLCSTSSKRRQQRGRKVGGNRSKEPAKKERFRSSSRSSTTKSSTTTATTTSVTTTASTTCNSTTSVDTSTTSTFTSSIPPRPPSPPPITRPYRYNIPPSYYMNTVTAPKNNTPINLSTSDKNGMSSSNNKNSSSSIDSNRSSNSSSPQIVHQSSNINRSTVVNSSTSYQQGVALGYSYQIDERRSNLMYPTFPDVRLRKLPFYKVMATLMQPCSLQPSGTARFQEQKFSFYLSPSQVQEIASSAFRDANGKPDNKKQVQLRFSLLETSCEQDDNFPSSISVKVNNKLQSLPNPIPTNKPGVEPKRPPKPINITSLCKLSSTLPNFIDVSWAVDFGRGFTVSVYFVDKLSAAELLKDLKDRGTRLPDYTRALIKEKLNDKDSDIATTSCKVTLACPLGKMRMSYPCRANTCDHLQCFDANLFLMMNERKPKWLCPVCNKPALFDNLLLDGFFKEVLLDSRLPSDDHEIVLHNDGAWEPLPTNKKEGAKEGRSRPEPEPTPVVLPTAKPVEKIETFNVDDDDDDELRRRAQPVGVSTGLSAAAGKKKNIDCITLDSDDNGNDNGSDSDSVVQPVRKRPRKAFLDDTPSHSPTPPASVTNSIEAALPPINQEPEEPVVIDLDDD